MQVFRDVTALQAALKPLKQAGKSIGFVPTMGNLHDGHLSLVKAAKQQADITVASIFVNPAQFGPNEDLDSYPRTFDEDCKKLEALNTDIVFAPDASTMYPADIENHTLVKIPKLSAELCGVTRPVFFQGITTIVCKLFNIVQPDLAFFGEKDFQQLLCIRKMVKDLHMTVEVVALPTVREKNGLAMSSRNNYLNAQQKEKAAALQEQLQWLREQIQAGEQDFTNLEEKVKTTLNNQGFESDYISVRRQSDLNPPEKDDQDLIVLGAAILEATRLIDNIRFKR